MKRTLLLSVLLLAACDLPSGSLPPTATPVGGPAAPLPATTYGLNLLVLGKDGAPLTQPTTVQLSLDSATRALGLGLSSSAAGITVDSLEVTTDARGLTPVWLTFGGRPGHAVVRARAATVGLDHTIEYELPAGTVATLDVFNFVPPYVGDTSSILWRSYDSQFQPVFAEVSIDVSNPALGTLLTPTQLVATNTGYGWVRGVSGGAHDSVPLAVVPHGRLGAVTSGQWTEFDLNGTNHAVRFNSGGNFIGPRYSASGDTLIYGENSHIMLRAGSAAPVQVVPGALGFLADRDPSWSPDGQWIYFAGQIATGVEIWRIHPNGTGAARVGPAATAGEFDRSPSVNPAGALLAMVTSRTTAGGIPTVRIINIASGATVFQGPAGTMPRFDPFSGATMVFISDGAVLMQVNADGSNLHRLDPSLTNVYSQLDWMHSGRWLVVSAVAPQGQYLHLVDTQTNGSIRLPYAFTRTLAAFR